MSKPFDVILYGATSFVGEIIAAYLQLQYPNGKGSNGQTLRWAMAGRSQAKLETVREQIGAPNVELIVADADNAKQLAALCAAGSVILSTVGPYALYGDELVAQCAKSGTHYCDLTGEVQWIRRMVDKHQAAAQKSGARIVHACGFDSIPSDMGVWFTQQQAFEKHGEYCNNITMATKAFKGGASGGTIASLLNVMKEASKDPQLRKQMQNPYSINPPTMRSGVRQPNLNQTFYESRAKKWMAPFVMAAINTRIVQRSHALLGQPWGADFVYREAMMSKGRITAKLTLAGLGVFMGAAAIKPSRLLLEKFVLPAPGEGPTPEQQENGFFDLRFFGTTASGKEICTKVTGDKDPGYGSTAKMIGEAAACLAQDTLLVKGGLWTPSTAMGELLYNRLKENAGLTFETL